MTKNNNNNIKIRLTPTPSFYLMFAFLISNCSGISLGPAGAPNDAVPTGNIVHQGTFVGLNGQTSVTGQDIFYNGNGVGNYILRLAGVNFPVESGLQVQVYSGNNLVQSFSLTASTGNQNYSLTGVGTQINFSIYGQLSVYIHSTLHNTNYAVGN